MSKLDAQRALKEAKYAREMAAAEARRKAAGKPAAAPVAPPPSSDTVSKTAAKSTTKVTASKSAKDPSPKATVDAAAGACGHRSMNGRTCTREAGHSEKSHRYS